MMRSWMEKEPSMESLQLIFLSELREACVEY